MLTGDSSAQHPTLPSRPSIRSFTWWGLETPFWSSSRSLDRSTPQRHWICPCQPLETGHSTGPWWCNATARAGYAMTTTTIHAFVSSWLDYCNSLYACVNNQVLEKLQANQNAVVTGARKCECMTHVLQITFKTAVLACESQNGMALQYLQWQQYALAVIICTLHTLVSSQFYEQNVVTIALPSRDLEYEQSAHWITSSRHCAEYIHEQSRHFCLACNCELSTSANLHCTNFINNSLFFVLIAEKSESLITALPSITITE